jgi:hypothetical protein
MNRSVPLVLVLALVFFPFFLPSVLRAQTSDERVPATVRTGLKVSIVDEHGRQIDGRVDGVSEGVIRLSRRGAIEEIALDRVVRIDEPDGLRNGALAGLGVGLSLGLLGAAVQTRGAEAKWVLAGILYNGVAFTLLGTGIDAVFDNRRTLYERGGRIQTRVSPIVGRGVRGAAVSWTW